MTTTTTTLSNDVCNSGLSYGFISFPWSAWISGDYSKPYSDAIETIYKRANYNASKWNSLPGKEDYPIDNVAAVIDAYGKGVLEEKIPVYNEKGTTQEKNVIYDYVAQQSGISKSLVQVVMYEAYWACYGVPQQVNPDLIIDPNKLKKSKDNWLDKLLGDTADTITLVKWLAIIGLGAYAVSQVNVAIKSVKR